MIVFLTTLLILLCLVVVLLILIQRTSGGMGSALGGGSTDQYLGAGSAAQLSKLTVWAILFFFILSFGLYALYQSEAGTEDELLRSGNVSPSFTPSDVTLPQSSPVNPEDASIPSSQKVDDQLGATLSEASENPPPVQPIISGNTTE